SCRSTGGRLHRKAESDRCNSVVPVKRCQTVIVIVHARELLTLRLLKRFPAGVEVNRDDPIVIVGRTQGGTQGAEGLVRGALAGAVVPHTGASRCGGDRAARRRDR